MPAKNLLRVPQKGAYPHIYNKSAENRGLFCDEEDFKIFLSYLQDYLTQPLKTEVRKKSFVIKGKTFTGIPHQPKNYFNKIELLAYSLMPDHFHLIVHQKTEASLEGFIRSLCTRYSIYFNKKYHRQGALFEGPYKSAHLSDHVLLHLVSYLHKFHEKNKYSSEAEYLGQRETSWVEQSILLAIYANEKNKPADARGSYKEFAEKYFFDSQEQELLQGVLIEEPIPTLKRRLLYKDLSSDSLKPPTNTFKNNKQITRLPEYLTLSFVFIILLGLGIRNINVSSKISDASNRLSAKSSGDFSNPEVTSAIEDLSIPDSSAVLSVSTSAAPAPIEPSSIVYTTVAIKEGSGEISIYKEPKIDPENIITARAGDKLEVRPLNSEWFEVKLSPDTQGFILAKYLNLE